MYSANRWYYKPFVFLTSRPTDVHHADDVDTREATFYRRLGELVRDQRKRRRLTQVGLAELWQLDRTTVVNIEKGRQRVSIYQLLTLADHLGCAVTDLLPVRSDPGELTEMLRGKARDEREFSFLSDVVGARRNQA